MKIRNSTLFALCLAVPATAFADFGYQETTKITGGSIVGLAKMAGMFSKQARSIGDPITSTVLVKGNRMAHINPDHTQIVDLDRETITEIDHQKRQYTVMTFEQMKQRIEQAAREAEKKRAEASAQAQPGEAPPEMNFAVNVKNTGAARNVSGLDTSQAILSMTLEAKDAKTGQTGNLAITNDMWMAPEIPGYQEVRDFERRYALKMGVVLSGVVKPSMLGMQPGMGKGLAEMAKEMSKLKGIPIEQTTRIGTTSNGQPLPAASEAPLRADNTPATPGAGEVAQQIATQTAEQNTASAINNKLGGRIAGLGALSGLGGFGHKKKEAPPANQPAPAAEGTAAAGQPPAAMVLIESNTEYQNFSSASIDSSRFDVPAGYQKVELPANLPAN